MIKNRGPACFRRATTVLGACVARVAASCTRTLRNGRLSLNEAPADEVTQPTDVVYVNLAPLATWNRVISQILPSVSLINTTNNVLK